MENKNLKENNKKDIHNRIIYIARDVLFLFVLFIFFTPESVIALVPEYSVYDGAIRMGMAFIMGLMFIHKVYQEKKLDIFFVVLNIYCLINIISIYQELF